MEEDRAEFIAIIGMSCEFPGIKDPWEYWSILSDGIETISNFTDEELLEEGIPEDLIYNKNYIKRSGVLNSAGNFDGDFFGYSPKEALFMDPQHRKFLEHSYKALESAGIINKVADTRVGVFAGCGQSNYLRKNIDLSDVETDYTEFQKMIGNDKDFLAARVAYKLNLRGPAITVQTACSTSMTAIHTGIQNLLGFQCDSALCGAVSIGSPVKQGYLYSPGGILSSDGYCRAFDEDASGTAFGSGVGIVILKRLDDAIANGDNIDAVIRGIAINNDGSNKVGFTAPGVNGQADVIVMAHAISDTHPDQISYIEAHGTGTKLGDPIEIEALKQAFRLETEKIGFCGIGSVKPNIGHLDSVAGIAGLIKVVLSMKYKKIPATINFNKPNPEMKIEETPFYVNDKLRDWKPINGKRIAGVSAFGVGGTNVHAILEEWIDPSSKGGIVSVSGIIPFSGRTIDDCERNEEAYRAFLSCSDFSEFSNISYSLFEKRQHFDNRGFFHYTKNNRGKIRFSPSITSAINQTVDNHIVFCFPGQGIQITDALREIYKNNEYFSKSVDLCFALIKEKTDWDPYLIFRGESQEDKRLYLQTRFSQPLLFSIEWALSRMLIEEGILPTAFIGHSLGELVAACLSGVFSLETALSVVIKRGELMQDGPPGVMLAIRASLDQIQPFLHDNIFISAINAGDQIVVAGLESYITDLSQTLKTEQINFVQLANKFPFHTPLMEEISIRFKKFLQEVKSNPAQIPFMSNVTGEWVQKGDCISPDYWAAHMKDTVLFSAGATNLLKDYSFLIEVGPGNIVSGLIGSNAISDSIYCCEGVSTENSSFNWIDQVKGSLWLNGFKLNYSKLLGLEKCHYISTPTYQFSGKKYWISPVKKKVPESFHENRETSINNGENWIHDIWCSVLGYEQIDFNKSFFEIGGDSLNATNLIAKINSQSNRKISLSELMQNPTISSLKDCLENKEKLDKKEELFPILFPVQPNGSKQPLFLVAGAHGNRYYNQIDGVSSYEEDFLRYFSSLIGFLGTNQPIYGFRPLGIFYSETPHSCVEEMATCYISELKKVQPSGPYFIAGECVGGIIAYEIANQLIHNGEEVSHLILMDTIKPNKKVFLVEKLIYICRFYKKHLLNIIKGIEDNNFLSSIRFINEELKTIALVVLPITKHQRKLRQVLEGSYFYQNKLFLYKPKVYSGKTTLVINQEWNKKKPLLGWDSSLLADFNIQVVPGDHITRLSKYGERSGQIITEILNRN